MLFFQAEDGIRDIGVTGVQTCALPILRDRRAPVVERNGPALLETLADVAGGVVAPDLEAVRRTALNGRWVVARGDRESVVLGKSVDLGGRRIIKKKKHTHNILRTSAG